MNKNNKAKILIVDDVEANLVALETTLDDLNAETYCVQSGSEALQLITEHEFCVVLMDVQMPGLNGIETAELMRMNQYSRQVPIIFITAINKEKFHLFKGYEAGAVDYLFKPIEPYILRSKVQIFVDIFYHKTQKLIAALEELKEIKEGLEKNNQELKIAATHDSLTNIANRKQFEDELHKTILLSERSKDRFGVMIVDIDNFKQINDTMGHLFGDKVIKLVALMLKAQIRKSDFVARLGGDEFALIVNKAKNYEDIGKIAQNICTALDKANKINDTTLRASCSIGIACYPQSGKDAETLLKNADIAMYRAKDNGKNTFEFFSLALSKEYIRRSTIEKKLLDALDSNELSLVYQVLYNLQTKKPYGVETLVRWHSKELGEISPDEFIPIAEESGLIKPLGIWIIKNAFLQLSKWKNAGIEKINFSINLSAKQLLNTTIFTQIKGVLDSHQLLAEKIEIELTETTIMEKPKMAEEILSKFNNLGIRINIDDFGTGYSSLNQLRFLPISALKIDRSFIKDLNNNKNDTIIVKAILSLANSLGLKSVAEGIETKQQLDFLIKNGCNYAQGYYLAHPEKPEVIEKIFLKGKCYDKK